jgi:hypothetical protein
MNFPNCLFSTAILNLKNIRCTQIFHFQLKIKSGYPRYCPIVWNYIYYNIDLLKTNFLAKVSRITPSYGIDIDDC